MDKSEHHNWLSMSNGNGIVHPRQKRLTRCISKIYLPGVEEKHGRCHEGHPVSSVFRNVTESIGFPLSFQKYFFLCDFRFHQRAKDWPIASSKAHFSCFESQIL